MTDIEHELRVLDVSKAKVVSKLEKLGAKKRGEYFFKRFVFEVVPPKSGRWVRLRTDGKHSTLTVKQIDKDAVDGTSEWEVSIDDFETTRIILEKLGLQPKGYQENRRLEYELGNVQICIDSWPKIPTYLEIEGKSNSDVLNCAKKLGYSSKQLTSINTEKIYLKYGIDIRQDANLSFND